MVTTEPVECMHTQLIAGLIVGVAAGFNLALLCRGFFASPQASADTDRRSPNPAPQTWEVYSNRPEPQPYLLLDRSKLEVSRLGLRPY